MSNESQLLFKSAESMKASNKQKIYQPRAIQEESISQDSKQTSTLKKSMESRELMLLQVNQQLRQQLSKLQSEAYCKELEFQQKLLQSQKDHENMMALQKTKYEIIIQDLNAKLENITMQITQVNALFQQFQTDHQNCHINRPTTKKVQITESNLPAEVDCESQSGAFTARVESSNYMNQIANRSNPDEKLLFLYRREIDKIRQQTRNFEQKFEVEKNTIKQEIITLRNQKIQLQSIICKRANHSSEKKSAAGQSDNKTNRSKRESQSIRQYNHKSKQSFDF